MSTPPRQSSEIRLPSPAGLVRAAFRVLEWEVEVVRLMGSLPARVVVLLEDVDVILGRVRTLLDDVERTVAAIDGIVVSAAETVDDVRATVRRADRVVDDVTRTVEGADAIVARAGATVGSVDGVVTRVDGTVSQADALVVSAGALIGRVGPLLDFADAALAPVRPVVEALLVDADLDPDTARLVAARLVEVLVYADTTLKAIEPIMDEVLGSIEPHEVAAMVTLVDHLPNVVNTLEQDVLPVLASLDTVGPEVHEILEVAQQCLEALAGIPGFQFLRRRGENGRDGNNRD